MTSCSTVRLWILKSEVKLFFSLPLPFFTHCSAVPTFNKLLPSAVLILATKQAYWVKS